MEIRQARIEDVPELAQLYDSSFPDTSDMAYGPDDFVALIKSGKCFMPVVIEDGQIIGMAIAYDMVIWVYIDVITVCKRARNRGVATALIEHVHKLNPSWVGAAAAHGVSNVQSKRVFDKAGYDPGKNPYVWRIKEFVNVVG